MLRWEGAKDPDEFIKKYGAGAFRNLVEKSESQIDYRLKNIRSKYDLSIPEQKVDYLHEATRLVASFPGPVERQVYGARIAELAGISADAVQKEVEQRRARLLKRERNLRKGPALQLPYSRLTEHCDTAILPPRLPKRALCACSIWIRLWPVPLLLLRGLTSPLKRLAISTLYSWRGSLRTALLQ